METQLIKNQQETTKITHILVVGNQDWIDRQDFLKELEKEYSIQYLTTYKEASKRLWHNSYDLLIIENRFCKQHSIDLTTYSYARSKPSIILCQNKMVKLYYDLWKKFSRIVKVCATLKKLMFTLVEDDSSLISNIKKIVSNSYDYQQQINAQIEARW